MRGVLTSQYSYFAEYRYKLLVPEANLLGHFDDTRQQFLRTILNTSKQGRTWYTFNTEALEQALGETSRPNEGAPARVRALKALEFCHERGWIELESKQMTDVYRVSVEQLNQPGLAEQLYQHFLDKQQNEIRRIHHMLDLFQQPQCISRRLAEYFGDQMDHDCGICSVCRGQFQSWPAVLESNELASADLTALVSPLQQAIFEQYKIEASKELQTRFLCGIHVPWFSKVKARSLAGFGRFEQVPYAEVKAKLG